MKKLKICKNNGDVNIVGNIFKLKKELNYQKILFHVWIVFQIIVDDPKQKNVKDLYYKQNKLLVY